MSVLFVALPIALALGAAGMIACVYCIRGGQYDDMETPAIRMLIDDRADDRRESLGDSESPKMHE